MDGRTAFRTTAMDMFRLRENGNTTTSTSVCVCVQLWIRSSEPLGEQHYESLNNNKGAWVRGKRRLPKENVIGSNHLAC